MKSILYITLFMFSSNLFAQQDIASDPLFLEYEKEYMKYTNSFDANELQQLDQMIAEFYSKFNDSKAIRNYQRNKDQRRWLQRNISKTSFENVASAHALYDAILSIQNANEERSREFVQLQNQLLKKYDGTLIWNTLRSRQIK